MFKQKLYRTLLPELWTAIKFAAVGIVSTTVHFSVALSILAYSQLSPIVANFIAFLSAFVWSFLGHFNWTFRCETLEQRAALIRFFMVTLSAFTINNFVLLVLIEQTSLSEELAVSTAAIVIPLITFLTSRMWAFKAA